MSVQAPETEAERDRRLARAERQFADLDRQHTDLQTASVDSANQALKALLLLNGGGTVALLGFLASTFSAPHDVSQVKEIVASLRMFAWGAAAAVFASTLAYLCNAFYARSLANQEKQWTWPHVKETAKSKRQWLYGDIVSGVAVLAGLVSLGAFGFGVYLLNDLY